MTVSYDKFINYAWIKGKSSDSRPYGVYTEACLFKILYKINTKTDLNNKENEVNISIFSTN